MDIIQATITGVVQGLTEFLPVSSSGHLVLTASIYKLVTGKELSSGGNEEIFFDIMLHLGTLIAILIYFRTDIKNLFNKVTFSIKNNSLNSDEESKFPLYILAGTVATIFIAYPLKDFFESLVKNPAVVGIILMLTGAILFLTEFISDKYTQKTTLIGWKRALIIGIAQGLAVAPGLSRSGTTIAAGLATGLDRKTCAKFSFLLSVPIILMVTAYQSLDLIKTDEFWDFNWTAILIGTVIAAVVGYYCIKYFIQFISNHKLNGFALYCLIIGLGMFVYFGYLN
jgi:undecaprenyl-diphosphatase